VKAVVTAAGAERIVRVLDRRFEPRPAVPVATIVAKGFSKLRHRNGRLGWEDSGKPVSGESFRRSRQKEGAAPTTRRVGGRPQGSSSETPRS